MFLYEPLPTAFAMWATKAIYLCIATQLDFETISGSCNVSVRARFHRTSHRKKLKRRPVQKQTRECTSNGNSDVRQRFADISERRATSLYGAILRQTSKNKKTLEDSCTPRAVLKLWMAKTFEKITLFVKMISAKIFMYGRSHRCCQ